MPTTISPSPAKHNPEHERAGSPPPRTPDSKVQNPLFNPPPETTALLFNQLLDPTLSLLNIAAAHNTTLEALSLLLARPDIHKQLDILQSQIADRARLIATDLLPAAAKLCHRIIAEHNNTPPPVLPGEVAESARPEGARPQDAREEPKSASPESVHRLRVLEHHRRSHETARRAASLLNRIARYQPGPVRPRHEVTAPRVARFSEPGVSRAHTDEPAPPAPQKSQGFPSLGPSTQEPLPLSDDPRAHAKPFSPRARTTPDSPLPTKRSAAVPLPLPDLDPFFPTPRSSAISNIPTLLTRAGRAPP